jgi:hypothetical protein
MKRFFEKVKETPKKKLIVIIVAIVLAIIIIPSGIKCIVYQESPAQLVSDIFSSNKSKIVGKWQGEEAVSAYEFYEDGTYDSYISTFSYNGAYTIKGNKITLKNSSLDGSVTYKFSINGDQLTMKLVESDSSDSIDKQTSKYTKVDKITMLSISDLLDDYVKNSQESDDNE